jgi:precorrin-6B methylase 2
MRREAARPAPAFAARRSPMTPDDARALIAATPFAPGPQTWADLGCGAGAFTLALASLLPAGSTIHAMDRDRAALAQLPATRRSGPSRTPATSRAGRGRSARWTAC